MEIVFTSKIFLWFLLSIPLLMVTHFFILKYLKRRALKFANFEAIQRVSGKKFATRNSPLLFLRMLTLTFLILSLSGPVLWYSGTSGAYNVVLDIDTSASMLADDFSPNRLDAAKESAASFVEHISARTKIGVVTFSGTSFINQGLTTSAVQTKKTLKDLQISQVGGTDIGESIITSSNLLITDKKSKIIVLLTDGQSNVGTPVEKGIEYAKKNHVIVNTIGIGTTEGGKFMNVPIVSTLDETELKKIADETGGKYYRAENIAELSAAYDQIASTVVEKISIDLQFAFLLLTLVMVFLEWGLMNTRYRILP